MMERIHGLVPRDAKLELFVPLPVHDQNTESVVAAVPQQRDLDPVALPIDELLKRADRFGTVIIVVLLVVAITRRG